MITTIFTVIYTINGTDVRCIADNNINMTIFTLLAYVYAQGQCEVVRSSW